jgi:hypothetical protein
MPAEYSLGIGEEVLAELVASPRSVQRRMVARLERLKRTPFRPGDYQEPDSDGGVNEVLLIDDLIVTYHADHADKVIRVLRVEWV